MKRKAECILSANHSKGSTRQQTRCTRVSLKKNLLTHWQSGRLESACLPAPGQISSHYLPKATTKSCLHFIYHLAASFSRSKPILTPFNEQLSWLHLHLLCPHRRLQLHRVEASTSAGRKAPMKTSWRADSSRKTQTACLGKVQSFVFVIFVMSSNVSGLSCSRSHH